MRQTETLEVGQLGYDPLGTYIENAKIYGADRLFLLQSVSGPAADNRESIVGLFGPLCIAIKHDKVSVDATEPLRTVVLQALRRGGVIDADSVVTNRRHAWRIPRILFDELGFDGMSEGLNGFFVTLGYDAVFYAEDIPQRIVDSSASGADIEYRLVVSTVRIPSNSQAVTVSSISGPHWDYSAITPVYGRDDGDSSPEPTVIDFDYHDEMTAEEFASKVAACKEYIRAGDIYQVQIGHKIEITSNLDPIDVYRRLRARNPSPYMALVPVTSGLMIVASPELYVRKEGSRAVMRPIAGTARKIDMASGSAADLLLSADEKECAEHIMLVDLCRNDLGRVARYGTLKVPEFMAIEEYSHLYHMVSEVEIDIREPFDVYDVIEAGFPAGTMTGAPKIRAVEIIEELEKSRREYYAGAFGLVPFTGDCVLGLSIRMALQADNKYLIRASAGIVADSKADSEWRETLAKMAAAFWAITGEELL